MTNVGPPSGNAVISDMISVSRVNVTDIVAGDPELTKQRATLLFELLKKGKELTAEKCYNMDELNAKG